jgi:gluconolactonase
MPEKLYVVSAGKRPGGTGPGGKSDMFVFDVGVDKTHKSEAVQRFHD